MHNIERSGSPKGTQEAPKSELRIGHSIHRSENETQMVIKCV